MTSSAVFRRPPLGCLLLLVPFAGCSGSGSGPAPAPAIVEFRAERSDYRLGEHARLLVRYTGGEGRIEPGGWPVGEHAWFETPPLELSTTFELVVGQGPAAIRRSLTIAAPYRERFREVTMGFAAAGHAAVATADGGALVIGGDQGLPILGYEIFRFDPTFESFRSFGQLYYGRHHHRAVRLGDGRTLVVGGELSANILGTPSELIDERTGQVTLAAALVRSRSGHTATLLADGRVLVLGGSSNDRLEPDVRASAETWDEANSAFEMLTQTMTRPRVGHTATRLLDGRVLIYGGGTRSGSSTAVAELFDPVTDSFSALADPENGLRTYHCAVVLDDGRVLIAGGEDQQGAPLASCLLFDPSTAGFVTAPAMSVARTFPAVGRLADGRTLVAGGANGTPTASSELRGSDGAFRTVESMGHARRYHTLTRLANGKLLIVGGEGPGGVLRNTAELFE